MQVERMWPGASRSVPHVRAWVREVLAGVVPVDVVDAAELVVSELAANTVMHTTSALMCVHLDVGSECVWVSVSDQGAPTVPAPRQADVEECGGRGLTLVRALASRLTIEGDVAGRTVSAALPVLLPPRAEQAEQLAAPLVGEVAR